jgi:hypothetical protein
LRFVVIVIFGFGLVGFFHPYLCAPPLLPYTPTPIFGVPSYGTSTKLSSSLDVELGTTSAFVTVSLRLSIHCLWYLFSRSDSSVCVVVFEFALFDDA